MRNLYGFLKESFCRCTKKSPKQSSGAHFRVPKANVLGFKAILGRHGGQNGPEQASKVVVFIILVLWVVNWSIGIGTRDSIAVVQHPLHHNNQILKC